MPKLRYSPITSSKLKCWIKLRGAFMNLNNYDPWRFERILQFQMLNSNWETWAMVTKREKTDE